MSPRWFARPDRLPFEEVGRHACTNPQACKIQWSRHVSPQTSGGRAAGSGAMATTILVLASILMAPSATTPNGLTQREIQGRVESLDASSGRLVVARSFGGRTTRVQLRAARDVRVFACTERPRGLDQVSSGMLVSVFYEVLGSDGVANLIVIEERR